jgi:oligosaccharide repeat unit polymerase
MPDSLNIFSSIVAAMLLFATLVVDVRHDLRRLISGRSVVLLGIASWFLLEAIKLSPEVSIYSQSQYDFGVLCVVLATLSFLGGYHLTSGWKGFEAAAAKVCILDDHRILWRLVALCTAIGFAPILVYSGLQIYDLLHGILGMRETWGGLIGRGRYGGFREAMLQLENLITGIAPFAVILFLDRRSTPLYRIVCATVVIWTILRAYGSGTRGSLLLSVLPLVAVVYCRARPRTQRVVLVAGICATPIVYAAMAAMVESRNSGTFSWEARNKATYVGNEMFQELLYMTTKVPESVPYRMGGSYIVQLCSPVPRFLWPGKPSLDTGIQLAELRGEVDPRTGQAYYTRCAGLLGEMYLNFGLPGIVVLSVFGGWLVRGWDWIPKRFSKSLPTMMFYLAGLGALFFQGRGFSIQTLYPLGFFFVAVCFLSYRVRTDSRIMPRDGRQPAGTQRRWPRNPSSFEEQSRKK